MSKYCFLLFVILKYYKDIRKILKHNARITYKDSLAADLMFTGQLQVEILDRRATDSLIQKLYKL